MMAMLFASVALSIDGMLPALPQIARTLTPGDPNLAQLVVTSMVLGLGIGTLISGPISDALGRKPVLIGCCAVYVTGAGLSFFAPSLPLLLAARVIMGIGGAGPRAVGMALIRDLYRGRDMARIVSFVMTVFTMVPAVAPLIGQGVIWVAGWREMFLVFLCFQASIIVWFSLRQSETLAVERRRRLAVGPLVEAGRIFARNRVAMTATLAQALSSGCLFSLLSSVQPVFQTTFNAGATFPLWFAVITAGAATGAFVNARVVMRYGMQRVVRATYLGMLVLSAATFGSLSAGLAGNAAFALFILWAMGLLTMIGLTLSNLAALAMEDMGDLAGFASSIMAAFARTGSVLLAVPVGLMFDGSALPLVGGVTVFVALALTLTPRLKKPEGAPVEA